MEVRWAAPDLLGLPVENEWASVEEDKCARVECARVEKDDDEEEDDDEGNTAAVGSKGEFTNGRLSVVGGVGRCGLVGIELVSSEVN